MQLCICYLLSIIACSSFDTDELFQGRQASTGGLRCYQQFYESNLCAENGVRDEEVRQPPKDIQHRRYRKQIGEYHTLPRFGRPHKRNPPGNAFPRRRPGTRRFTSRVPMASHLRAITLLEDGYNSRENITNRD